MDSRHRIAAGLTVIWYTSFFASLSFLQGNMRLEATTVEVLMLISGLISMSFYVLVGKWSDRVGRKPVLVAGWALALPVPLLPSQPDTETS